MSTWLLCPEKEQNLAQNAVRDIVLEIRACEWQKNADLSGKIDRIQHERCCIALTTQCPGGAYADLDGRILVWKHLPFGSRDCGQTHHIPSSPGPCNDPSRWKSCEKSCRSAGRIRRSFSGWRKERLAVRAQKAQ